MQAAADIPVRVIVPGDTSSSAPLVSSERRISPAWTIEHLKAKLESVTGIPPSCQRLRTKDLSGNVVALSDDDALVGDSRWGLGRDSELEVHDIRPPAARQNLTDVSTVPKYEMPQPQYEQLNDSVLAWKKRQKLGRFDPNARSLPELIEERKSKDEDVIREKGIKIDLRCRIGSDDTRRGIVKFVGPIEGLGGDREAGCRWVGIELDEPLGRNDGSVKIAGEREGGKEEIRRVFECKDKFGVLARPEKVEVGGWPPLDDLEVGEDMEEI